MAPEELLAVLKERPFKPFRINLTHGRTVDVRHPEMVLAGRRTAIIGLPDPAESEPLYEKRLTVDLLHIVSLQPLPNGE